MSGTSTTGQQTLVGFRTYTVRQGDTLQAIASRELGAAALWTNIAQLNNLLPPYIVDTLADLQDAPDGRVVLVGQVIRLPSPGRTPSGVLDATDLFGTDLDLTGGVLTADASGDLALITGAANLKQAIENRLDTHPGDLIWHPLYGCRIYELVGRGNDGATDQIAAGYVERALRSDPRVSSVQNLTASVAGDTTSISGTAVAINGKHLPVGGE